MHISWGWIIFIAAIAIVMGWIVSIYNRLIRLRNQVKNGWSQIDVQLQRRYDLIPNLVETVKGYMDFEKSTLKAVIEARNQASQAREQVQASGGPLTGTNSLEKLAAAETALKSSLGHFFALAEAYPQLRSTENMQRLQEELASTENRIAFSRQSYNDTVMLYNMSQQEFPTMLFATSFGHHPAALFEVVDQAAKKAVKVKF